MLLAALWAIYVVNRLWQQSLAAEAAGALAEAAALGLDVLPPTTGACLVAVGQLEGQDLRLEWRGGLYGERSILRRGGTTTDLPLLRDASSLREALGLARLHTGFGRSPDATWPGRGAPPEDGSGA